MTITCGSDDMIKSGSAGVKQRLAVMFWITCGSVEVTVSGSDVTIMSGSAGMTTSGSDVILCYNYIWQCCYDVWQHCCYYLL